MTKSDELDLIIRVLGLLHSISVASIRAVPPLFRPAGVQAKLDEIGEILGRLRKP